MFDATLNLVSGYPCRTNVIFGTLTDGSLEINSLSLNKFFSYINVFQNGDNTLSKMFFKKPGFFFLSKSSKFRVVWIVRFCSNFTGMWYKHSPNMPKRRTHVHTYSSEKQPYIIT